jgi:hypothetical protein
MIAAGSPTHASCPASRGSPGTATPTRRGSTSRARCASSSPRRCPPGWPCSTPRTSTRSSRPTAPLPLSCSRRPTSGCSSPRRHGMRMPCRGTAAHGRRPRHVRCHRPRPDPRRGHRRDPPPPGDHAARAGAAHRTHLHRPEAPLDADGQLPPEAVERLSAWLHALASDSRARSIVVGQTLRGAVDSLSGRTSDLVVASRDQHDAATALCSGPSTRATTRPAVALTTA